MDEAIGSREVSEVGNAYPVVEHHLSKGSHMGKPLQSGCQSHYVLTKKDGTPVTKKMRIGMFYDELVLSQESQVPQLPSSFFFSSL